MTMSKPTARTLLAAALALSAGLSVGCVTHHHDHAGRAYRYDPYYGGYGRYDHRHPRHHAPRYGHPRPHPHPGGGGWLDRGQDRERHALERDQQHQDRALDRAHRDERRDLKDSGEWDRDDRRDQRQEHRAQEREQQDDRQDLRRDHRRERQDERNDWD